MDQKTIHAYVDAAAEQLLRQGLRMTPLNVPLEMRDQNIPVESDWVGWKPIPSTVTDADVADLEGIAGATFPPAYRAFLQYRHFYDLSEVGVRFYPHAVDSWRSNLVSNYAMPPKKRIAEIGLIPFGREAMMDAGPVCFDTRVRSADGDCPVVFWDHEWVDTEREVRPLFSSCMKMFECLLFVVSSEITFVCHDRCDAADTVKRKKDLMSQFLSTDPNGAGGPARVYWTCWGVNPDS